MKSFLCECLKIGRAGPSTYQTTILSYISTIQSSTHKVDICKGTTCKTCARNLIGAAESSFTPFIILYYSFPLCHTSLLIVKLECPVFYSKEAGHVLQACSELE